MGSIDSHDLAWLAGWLEGEGCFTLRKPRGGHGWGIAVSAVSTDEDVIRRVAAITGIGSVRFRKPQQLHHQDSWIWQVSRRPHVLSLLRELLPLMGERRSEKIREMLVTPEPKTPRERMAHRLAPCGTASCYARGCRCDDCRVANTKRCREYQLTRVTA